ncbi:MAG TPA: 4Fe-4S dicluster domain-containing protein [Candidatus Acidoferrales bacterium]|nr:4Fe-4S dicluster domain-containing protein [Candidatus Acidoferrales bacterium]
MPEMLLDRSQQSVTDVFLEDVYSIPHGEKIKECIQCGTCSASCPTSYAMDYTPREVIASLRAGLLDRVLKSNTIWLCASCYYCTVRCPSGIKLTDIMYELKRLAVEFGYVQKSAKAAIVSKLFVDLVDKNGRIAEVPLVGKFFLKTNPFAALGMMPRAWKLFRRGRMPMIPNRIKGAEDLKIASENLEITGVHAGAKEEKT